MGNHMEILVRYWNDKDPNDKQDIASIKMSETADSNQRYADFACSQSKWQRPGHPMKRGNLRFRLSRPSWELVYEVVRMFVMPREQDEVDSGSRSEKEEEERKIRETGGAEPTAPGVQGSVDE